MRRRLPPLVVGDQERIVALELGFFGRGFVVRWLDRLLGLGCLERVVVDFNGS